VNASEGCRIQTPAAFRFLSKLESNRMSLPISSKTEARLLAKARELGRSVETFIEKLLTEAGDLKTSASNGERRTLPVWHLGVGGELHRRDIYDGIR
jgi:hypothetical protein